MSYVIRRSGKNGWRVQKQIYEGNAKHTEGIPKALWHELGFKPEWSIEEARKRAHDLNKQNTVERLVHIRAAKQAKLFELIKSVYLPEETALRFQDWLVKNHPDSKRMIYQWKTAQTLVDKLKLLPEGFAANRGQIYLWFISEEFSLDWSQRLVRMLNMWSEFFGDDVGRYYRPIPKMTRAEANRINDAYLDSKTCHGPSDPLTPNMLNKLKEKLPIEQYRWLAFTVWFGLRPSEVSALQDKKRPARIEHNKDLGVDVLYVYQNKLKRIARDKRWKAIPAFLPEQIETLKSLELEKRPPLNKTLQDEDYLDNDQITLYSGRKGFVDLMLDRGQTLEDISMWLGHQTIQMTWNKYRNKKRVSFTDVNEKPPKAG